MDPADLTLREQQVLLLIGEGKTTKEIAGTLGLSPATVAVYRKNICRYLNLHSTAELVASGLGYSQRQGPAAVRKIPRKPLATLGARLHVGCRLASRMSPVRPR